MASDYFLYIDGIKGESKEGKHRDWIELESFSWGASNAGASGASAWKGDPYIFHKTIDKASPLLAVACAKGNHIPQAILSCRRSTADTGDYYKVTLSDCLVSSFAHGGEEGGLPHEEVSFNYTKIEFSYAQVKGGTPGTPVSTGDIQNVP